MKREKWFVRTASLILMLGFFMPTMLVSCSGMAIIEKSFSLADLAAQVNQPILYVFVVGSLTAGVFSFLPEHSEKEIRNFLILQGAAVGVGLLALMISIISLTGQIRQGTNGMFDVRPDYGAFVLIAGIVLFAIGWIPQWAGLKAPAAGFPPWHDRLNQRTSDEVGQQQPGRGQTDDEETGGEQLGHPARLELVKGELPRRVITVDRDNFTIGRGADNNLQIHVTTVSRHHARLRYAEGAWFIQDSGSASGVIVNGDKVPATRLEPGDEIEIAGNVFIFRC